MVTCIPDPPFFPIPELSPLPKNEPGAGLISRGLKVPLSELMELAGLTVGLRLSAIVMRRVSVHSHTYNDINAACWSGQTTV